MNSINTCYYSVISKNTDDLRYGSYGNFMGRWELNGSGSGSCPRGDFDISGAET